MGLYSIPCPSCTTVHLWFSGSPDQRCPKCKEETRTISEDRAQIPSTHISVRSAYEPGQFEFEQWMKRYWGGVKVDWYEDASEYRGAVQMAWEAWRRFWPKDYPKDVKRWGMFQGARYEQGTLIEEYDHGVKSSMPPTMVPYEDYVALHKHCKDLEERIIKLLRTRDE